ncbi:putative protein, unknown function [Plasmodium gaboni]|uniref:Uncharacterized protein n=1 Tax=Plasmodium gaboni TaxID=647221 RepID=A0A151LDN0_9APIC|nr:putative protein, unknown function [Plasmodium gaboni]KYN96997.1 putative protein, unknown function [Plasmodium gaboni]SOV17418.1 probable protein, unknown function [Plasmodium gaboni]SOV24252.1 probable protein, unknown function [Plasmodium sp. DRC-Itaito]
MGLELIVYLLIYYILTTQVTCDDNYLDDDNRYNPTMDIDLSSSMSDISRKINMDHGKKFRIAKKIFKGLGAFMILLTSFLIVLDNITLNNELANYKKREIDLAAKLINAEHEAISSKVEYGRKVEEMQSIINKMIFHTLNHTNHN